MQMLQFVTSKEVATAAPYYRGRWPYFAEAMTMIRSIPGASDFDAENVLEIGPFQLPIVHGCHTMDNQDHGIPRTYKHDGGNTPWPISNCAYDLVIALQVFEHFNGRQREAWGEIRRIADWAVVSLPHMWPKGRDLDHEGISLETIIGWTGQQPVQVSIVPTPGSTLTRIVCLFDLRSSLAYS
jgi:hypothetical protein